MKLDCEEEGGTGAQMSGEGQRRSRRPPGFRTPVGSCQVPKTERQPLARRTACSHAPATRRMGARHLGRRRLQAPPPPLVGVDLGFGSLGEELELIPKRRGQSRNSQEHKRERETA